MQKLRPLNAYYFKEVIITVQWYHDVLVSWYNIINEVTVFVFE